MTIFLLMESHCYDSPQVVGGYRREEDAKAAAKHRTSEHYMYWVEEVEVDD